MRNYTLVLILIFSWILVFGQSDNIAPYKILSGHEFKIGTINFSGDDKLLISTSWDNTVRLWSMDSFNCIRIFKGHTDNVWGCAISSDNNFLASASLDRQLKLWDIKSGKEIYSYTLEPYEIIRKGQIPELDYTFPNSAYSVDFSPDNEFVAVGAADNLVRLFDIKTKTLTDILKGHTGSILGVGYSNDGKYLISGGNKSEIIIWETKTLKPIQVIEDKDGYNGAFTFTNDNKKVLISGKCKINIVEIETGKVLRTIPVQCQLQGVQLTTNERYMITCAEDYTVRLYDYQTGKELWVYRNPKPEICDCKLSNDNKYLAVSTPESDILIWKLDEIINTVPNTRYSK